MGALLIFLLFCLAVGAGAFFQGRQFVRNLERQYTTVGPVDPQEVYRCVAEAARGIRWTVSDTEQGLETRHAVGSVIRVDVEPQDDGTCMTTVFVRNMALTTQLGGIIRTPRAYRAIRRKRKRIIASASSMAGQGEWTEAGGLN
ncbi:hypothetical protein [Streptomyces sp. NPDC057939]|uniref:hypothetical protein n=1 Tax=Streptomyces sp. NPDC057939 TaxID=3346284 RepID=UPI0036E50B42